jgi:hypothetical protein
LHHYQIRTSVLPPLFSPAKTQGKQQEMDVVYEQFKLNHSGHSRAGSPCIITESGKHQIQLFLLILLGYYHSIYLIRIYLAQENLSPMLQGRGKKKMELLYDGGSRGGNVSLQR